MSFALGDFSVPQGFELFSLLGCRSLDNNGIVRKITTGSVYGLCLEYFFTLHIGFKGGKHSLGALLQRFCPHNIPGVYGKSIR